jgi:hypothetical protein
MEQSMTIADTKYETLKKNLISVVDGIKNAAVKSGRKPDDITLIAVTKYVGPEEINALFDLGVREFGESRVQNALVKIPLVKPGARWHMVGHLQTNKVKKALEFFKVVHSVDSTRLAAEINGHSADKRLKTPVLIQVNVSGEESKFGVTPENTGELADFIIGCEALELMGLMTMAPYADNPEAARPFFKKLRETRDELKKQTGLEMPWLSMGMTGDFEIAVEEGATHVRIGSALFNGLGPAAESDSKEN